MVTLGLVPASQPVLVDVVSSPGRIAFSGLDVIVYEPVIRVAFLGSGRLPLCIGDGAASGKLGGSVLVYQPHFGGQLTALYKLGIEAVGISVITDGDQVLDTGDG